MKNKIYLVTHGENERLVEAGNSVRALSHVVRDSITSVLATQEDLVRLVSEGVAVESIPENASDLAA